MEKRTKYHNYSLTNTWTGNRGTGTSGYRLYDRSHLISVHNKVDIECSSDPSFLGDATKYNPEELLLASLSSCHMLWYLHLCADAGVVVTEYNDHASGTMEESADGGGRFVEVILHPRVTVSHSSMIDRANALHQKANALCFISNSCNFPVKHQPTCNAGYNE